MEDVSIPGDKAVCLVLIPSHEKTAKRKKCLLQEKA